MQYFMQYFIKNDFYYVYKLIYLILVKITIKQ